MFVAIGREAFAERARRELHATGETVRRRSGEAAAQDELTARDVAELSISSRRQLREALSACG
jgi:hypothetical protein